MEWLLPLLGFVLVTTITPGPNNLLLAASGIRFGFKRTLPHVLGINLGVYGLIVLCGFGLGQLLLAEPALLLGLKIFATIYLGYLAWKILGTSYTNADEDAGQSARPMKPIEAVLFQLSNPKAWMMAATGLNFSLPIADDMIIAVIALVLTFATVGVSCNFIWVYAGASLQGRLEHPRTQSLVNAGLAALTVLTVAAFWLY